MTATQFPRRFRLPASRMPPLLSDYPFKNRAPHTFDAFERRALADLRANPNQLISDATSTIFADRVRLVAPIIMGAPCVGCHNTHPDSPKRDWKVGDVRGIQEVAINQQIAANLLSFKYLLIYFALIGTAGFSFLLLQSKCLPKHRMLATRTATRKRRSQLPTSWRKASRSHLQPDPDSAVPKAVTSGWHNAGIASSNQRSP
jgi:hypothetical protein